MIKIYNITMKTPFGTQNGRITFVINGSSLTGVLEGMGSKSKFINGKINGDDFEFSGEIKTLLIKIHYFAKGTLNNNKLTASVNTNHGIFSVTGHLVSKS
ncbi:hypothetical protein [Clostridium saccharobutylicum]|uniref:Uncharacterized protein n=1 Tax=Clostridium saccharobutylicum TaxID=169679 RepID=A0A1S8N2T9_CLOSA|nr:hypothetical protein [Clostridium saccharobutylicum]OOM10708.1 hypothetical protein CLOSAC_33290 [Clostridium saccharobutylicum]